jgi:hypothetical protein
MKKVILATASSLTDVTIPTEFKSAPPGQDVVTTESVVHERAVLTPEGWRLARIVTDPPPAAFLL